MSENSDLNKEKAMQEPLLLISGFAANEKAWSHQIEHLKEICNIQVIIMDRQLSRQQMVDHILSTAPKKFSLAGQSMGGWIAQAVAAEAGNQIDRLILLNTWCSSDPKLNEVEYQLMTALEHGEIEKIFSQHLPLILHSDHLHDAKILGAIQTMFMSFPIATLIHQLHAIMTDYESLPPFVQNRSQDPHHPRSARRPLPFKRATAAAQPHQAQQARLYRGVRPLLHPRTTRGCHGADAPLFRVWIKFGQNLS